MTNRLKELWSGFLRGLNALEEDLQRVGQRCLWKSWTSWAISGRIPKRRSPGAYGPECAAPATLPWPDSHGRVFRHRPAALGCGTRHLVALDVSYAGIWVFFDFLISVKSCKMIGCSLFHSLVCVCMILTSYEHKCWVYVLNEPKTAMYIAVFVKSLVIMLFIQSLRIPSGIASKHAS